MFGESFVMFTVTGEHIDSYEVKTHSIVNGCDIVLYNCIHFTTSSDEQFLNSETYMQKILTMVQKI